MMRGEPLRNKMLAVLNIERGRDSWGLVTENGVLRGLGSLVASMRDPAFPLDRFSCKTIIGHTRNSSVGAVTIGNAHPFRCGNIVGAHNGRVSNFWDLKQEFKGKYPEIDKLEVDSQVIFFLIDKLGAEDALNRIEGKVACWWYDVRESRKLQLWVWNQVLSIATRPNPAFSSEQEHLKICGYEDAVVVSDKGSRLCIDVEDGGLVFNELDSIKGYEKAAASTPITGFYVDGHGVNNDEESQRAVDEWDAATKKWISNKRLPEIESPKGVVGDELWAHRVLLTRLNGGKHMYSCTSCNKMDTIDGTTTNAHQIRVHVGCGGVMQPMTDAQESELKDIATRAIAEYLGLPAGPFTLRERRAFISRDKTLLPAKVENAGDAKKSCLACANSTCKLSGHNAFVASCDTFVAHPKSEYMCWHCGRMDCANSGLDVTMTICQKFVEGSKCKMCSDSTCPHKGAIRGTYFKCEGYSEQQQELFI